MRFFACVGVFLFSLGLSTSVSAVDPADKCAADKIKTAGKYSMCLLKEESKGIKKGLTPDFSKCDDNLTKKWTKIEDKLGGACPTLGDETPLSDQVNVDAAVIVAGLLGETSIGNGQITTEYDIFSIEPTDSQSISVDAEDGLGNPVGFTAAADDGSCATISADPNANSITVTGVGEHCEETITITSDTGITKTLTVNVWDPMVMNIGQDGEQLLITYWNDYGFQFNRHGCSGMDPVTFYSPAGVPAGWYPLGSLIAGYTGPVCWSGCEITWAPTILVSSDPNSGDLSNPVLKAPNDYEKIWDDQGSGCTNSGSIWKPLCDPGYVALGVVTQNGYTEPSTNRVRCVRRDYTIEANIGDKIWDDSGSGASLSTSAWWIGDPKIPSLAGERAPLHPGTMIGCTTTTGGCDQNLFNLLLVPLPVAERSDNSLAEVSLDENGEIVAGDFRYASSVRVPFSLIPNLACGTDLNTCQFNVESSPFYRVKRHDFYTEVQMLNNTGPTPDEMHVTYDTGFVETHSSTFSEQVGLEVKAEGSAKFLGSGGGWSVSLSTELGWEETSTSGYEEHTGLTWDLSVPPFTMVVAAQVRTRFLAFSEHEYGPVVLDETYPGGDDLRGGKNRIDKLLYPPFFP
jgi:hypothetical protein